VDSQKASDLQRSYDDVAEEYVRRIYDELKDKPLDRQLLDRFAAAVGEKGIVCDVGCGPGQVARYLSERGASVIGIDLSQQMIEQARRLNPAIEFRQGNMLALNAVDEAWAGITAFYSIIHIPRDEVVSVLFEFKRVLRPAGLLLLAFHIGDEVVHLDEWWERPVSADFVFFQPNEMTAYLREAGFDVKEVIERPPYENVEHPSRRAYIFARKPA
jgi:ubiquinone/menaquinone biosynthesis C-methylase UbiE